VSEITTVISALILLMAPFIVWLELKARARRKQQIGEINEALRERHRLIEERHAQLDRMDHRCSDKR
jgi:hypothetical protein